MCLSRFFPAQRYIRRMPAQFEISRPLRGANCLPTTSQDFTSPPGLANKSQADAEREWP